MEVMTPLRHQPSPPNRVELEELKIEIDLHLDEEEVAPAPVASATEEPIDIRHLTPIVHRSQPQHLPQRQLGDPRRSLRLAEPPTPLPFTSFIEEDILNQEDIKESGTESDSEHPTLAVRGVKSAVVRLDEESGRNKWYYETQWEGYGEDHNTWQLACDFDRLPTTKAMLRAARDGRDASSWSAKNLEQKNQIFAIHRKQRGYMAKSIDEKFTRTDLIFEEVYDSIVDPQPRHYVSILVRANISKENLYCKGRPAASLATLTPMIHSKFEGSTSTLKWPKRLIIPHNTVEKQLVPTNRDRRVSWGGVSIKLFKSIDIVVCPPKLPPAILCPIQLTSRLAAPATPVPRGIGGGC